jgi:glutathione peroxidase
MLSSSRFSKRSHRCSSQASSHVVMHPCGLWARMPGAKGSSLEGLPWIHVVRAPFAGNAAKGFYSLHFPKPPPILIDMMSHVLRCASALALAAAGLLGASSIYDFTLNSITGVPAPLAAYRGKVLLLVDVASYCGYTPQYRGLEALYEKYKDRGLVVIGFPANNFGEQEPGTNAEIKEFCERTYKVKFPMYAKISVLGADKAPLYRYLTAAMGGEIQWNFTKFLVGRDGKIVARFEPDVTPESGGVQAAIEKALGQ